MKLRIGDTFLPHTARTFALATFLFAIVAPGPNATGVAHAATPLLGSDFSGVLYDVNSLTGAASVPRPTGISSLVGIARSPIDGKLYGAKARINGPSYLYTIDPVTGASLLVGATGLNDLLEGDLAFDPTTGTLYAMYGALNSLLTLNTATGAATVVGNLSIPGDPSAMAFNANGDLFVLDLTYGFLRKVDKTNAQTLTTTATSLQSQGSVEGMVFDSAGTLFVVNGYPVQGVTPRLFTLDTTTGVLTPIGDLQLPSGLAGLALADDASVDTCGDGVVDAGEHCDDAALNGTASSCCSSDCKCNTGSSLAPACDSDGDGLANPCDNCPGQAHGSAEDSDGDGVGDACDNCTGKPDPFHNFNPDQLNSDCEDPDFFLDGNCPATGPQSGKRGCCDGGDVCDACAGDDQEPTPCDEVSEGRSIGPSGGSFSTPDGCITVFVPPNALASDTSVSVSVGNAVEKGNRFFLKRTLGAVYKVALLPEGQHFAEPVEVTFCWDASVDDQDALVLARNGEKFDALGFQGSATAQCSTQMHQTLGGCEDVTADCSIPVGTGKSTVAKCCNKDEKKWTFATCNFSEFYMGDVAGALIPGGGKFDSDCLHEWSVVNPLQNPRFDKKGLLTSKQSCVDGDDVCDADGTANGSCTFKISSCLAVHDPRLFDNDEPDSPLCPASSIGSWELVRPQVDATNPVDAANALKLRDAVRSVAPSTVAGSHQSIVSFSPALAGPDFCAHPILFEVPLRGDKRGKATLKTRTVSGGGVEDSDKLRLICKPS